MASRSDNPHQFAPFSDAYALALAADMMDSFSRWTASQDTTAGAAAALCAEHLRALQWQLLNVGTITIGERS